MFCWGDIKSVHLDLLGKKCFEGAFDNFVPQEVGIVDVVAKDSLITFVIKNREASVAKVITEKDEKQGSLVDLDLRTNKLKFIGSETTRVLFVSGGGKVIQWTRADKSRVPRRIGSLFDRQVTQVACGNNHSVALTADSQLFTWGQNSSGQLGLGKGEPSSVSPQPLKSLLGIPLVQISAGGDHSFALSLSGAVFGWGKNSAGQLGLGDNTDQWVPVSVSCLNLKKTTFITCGEEHTATLTKGGVVFTFGSSRYGQLGHNSFKDEFKPRLVAELWQSQITQLSCGRYHTLAFAGSTQTIYSFGCSKQGQLGKRKGVNQAVPLPVELTSAKDHKGRIERIIAGGNYSFALCSSQGYETDLNSSKTDMNSDTPSLCDSIIDRWISGSSSKTWKAIQKEIKKIFSTATCMNRSFVAVRCDEHYRTSVEHSGLDLSFVRIAFEKLAKEKKLLTEVEKVVVNVLLPSLSSRPAGVEALRVYLILPELLRVLHKQQHGKHLTVAFATAILDLQPDSFKVLETYWSKLPDSFLRTLVTTFRIGCESFFCEHAVFDDHERNGTLKMLQVLQVLYESTCTDTRRRIAAKMFYIKEAKCLCKNLRDLQVHRSHFPYFMDRGLMQKIQLYEDKITLLKTFPCVIDFDAKRDLFYSACLGVPLELQFLPQENVLRVNRQTLLRDVFQSLRSKALNMKKLLAVEFEQEAGIDMGGVSLEFFSLLSKQLLAAESKIAIIFEDSGLAWFTSNDTGATDEVYLFGIICGMAAYNHRLMNFGFPTALFKMLLGLKPTLQDLEELSPVEARSLTELLMEDEEVVDDLFLDFTVKGQEIIANGGQIPVTKANRQKYVDLYVDYVFQKSVQQKFEDFARGFSHGCPVDAWTAFLPEELVAMLYGNTEYKWEELRENAVYENCLPTEELILNFWHVFSQLEEEDKKRFLSFVFGTDLLPAGGLSKVRLKIMKLTVADADDRYPEAHTCFRSLHLPNYSNIRALRDKLIDAITYCQVFGQQ